MWRHVALIITDVSEELSPSIVRMTTVGNIRTMLAVTSNLSTLRRNSHIDFTDSWYSDNRGDTFLRKWVLTRATRPSIPEDGIILVQIFIAVGLRLDTAETFCRPVYKALLLSWRRALDPPKDAPVTFTAMFCYLRKWIRFPVDAEPAVYTCVRTMNTWVTWSYSSISVRRVKFICNTAQSEINFRIVTTELEAVLI
jgi:hypothetical protein